MQKMNFVSKQVQSGFTLIELVVVIVILGILAATALPKFASMGGDARAASAKAAGGALSAAVAMAHSKWLIAGSPTSGSGLTIALEGSTNVEVTSAGWPVAEAGLYTAAGISTTDYVIASDFLSVSPIGASGATTTSSSSTCRAAYTESSGAVATTTTTC